MFRRLTSVVLSSLSIEQSSRHGEAAGSPASRTVLALLVVASLALATSASGQTVLLEENFEAGSPPSGWTLGHNTPSVGWEFGTDLGSTEVPIPPRTRYAASNDDAHDASGGALNRADIDRLITPILDLAAHGGGALIQFDYVQPGTYSSTGSVEVSDDWGATWTEILTVDRSSGWVPGVAAVSGLFSDHVLIAFRHNDQGGWGDLFAVDNVRITSQPPRDAELEEITTGPFAEVGSTPLTARVRNLGSATISSLELSYRVDGGAVVTATVGGLDIPVGTTAEVVHPIPADLPTPGLKTITMTIDGVDGAGPDLEPSNDEVTGELSVLSALPPRRPVLSVHTGAWTGFGPDGDVRADEVRDTIPEAILVTVHNGDAMEIPEGVELQTALIGGYPSGTVDNFRFEGEFDVEVSRGEWLGRTTERLAHVTPASVAITSRSFDPVTRSLDVTVAATFYGDVDADLRLNAWLVEEEVTGEGSGYDQVNFSNGTPGHPYEGAGDPIVGFVHDRTLRAMLGGAWGTAGVIPASVADGETYSTSYSTTVPAGWDADALSIVGVVSTYGFGASQRTILNATEVAAATLFTDGFESGSTSAWSGTP